MLSDDTQTDETASGTDITLYRCRLCNAKKQGRIDMFQHFRDDHSFRELVEPLMENIESKP